MRQLRVVRFEGRKRGLLRKCRGYLRAGVRYQKTDGTSQLTGDMSRVAPHGRIDQCYDAFVTAVSLESRSRDPDLRRVSSSFSGILARATLASVSTSNMLQQCTFGGFGGPRRARDQHHRTSACCHSRSGLCPWLFGSKIKASANSAARVCTRM